MSLLDKFSVSAGIKSNGLPKDLILAGTEYLSDEIL
jgi:hypothetical protein